MTAISVDKLVLPANVEKTRSPHEISVSADDITGGFAEHLRKSPQVDTRATGRDDEPADPPEEPPAADATVQQTDQGDAAAEDRGGENDEARSENEGDSDRQDRNEGDDDASDDQTVAAAQVAETVVETALDLQTAEVTLDESDVAEVAAEGQDKSDVQGGPVVDEIDALDVDSDAAGEKVETDARSVKTHQPDEVVRAVEQTADESPEAHVVADELVVEEVVTAEEAAELLGEAGAAESQPRQRKDKGEQEQGEGVDELLAATEDADDGAQVGRRRSRSRGDAEKIELAAPEVQPASDDRGSSSADRTAAPEAVGANESSVSERLPKHLFAGSSQRGEADPKITQADQTRFVNRVAKAFEAARARGGELRLRLSPPELGSLKLEIKVQGGVMTARLEAETPAARTLLSDNLPVLRERLAEQGVRIEQFDIDLMDRHSGQMPEDFADNQRGGEEGSGSNERVEVEQARADESPAAVGDGALNVIV